MMKYSFKSSRLFRINAFYGFALCTYIIYILAPIMVTINIKKEDSLYLPR